jgi:glutamate/tyrosine decarboxylase-like PLP-dependent enzyme
VDETLPPQGWDPARTAEALAALGGRDVHWREGRAWSLVYSAGPEAAAVADDASRRYGAANALNVEAFPSLAATQRDVVATVAGWVDAPPDAAGWRGLGAREVWRLPGGQGACRVRAAGADGVMVAG